MTETPKPKFFIPAIFFMNILIMASGVINVAQALDPNMDRLRAILGGGIGAFVAMIAFFTAIASLRYQAANDEGPCSGS